MEGDGSDPSCLFPSLMRLWLQGILTYLQIGGGTRVKGKGGMGLLWWVGPLGKGTFPSLSWVEFGCMGFGTDLWG